MKRLYALNLLGLSLLWSFAAAAMELSPTVSLHGYASVIGAKSENNPWTTQRTLDRWDWAQHEAGLTLNWTPAASTRLTASVVSRNRGEVENGEPKLQILSINHLFQEKGGQVWGVRIGRVKNTLIGLYSSQSVPSERNGVIFPVLYQGSIREALEAMDGAGIYGEGTSDAGDQFEWQLYGGGRDDLDQEHEKYRLFGGDAPGKLGGIRLLGAKLLWVPAAYPNLAFATSVFHFHEGYHHAQSEAEAAAKALSGACMTTMAPCLTDFYSDMNAWFLSGQGEWGRWSLMVETGIIDVDTEMKVVDQKQPFKTTVYTGYVQLGYTPTHKWQLWLRGGAAGLSKKWVTPGNPYIYYTQVLTLAGRYYFSPSWFITAQTSQYDGTMMLEGFRGLLNRPLKRRWGLYLVSLTWQF